MATIARFVRVSLAVIAGFFITCACGIIAFVLGLIYNIFIAWWAPWSNPIQLTARVWSVLMVRVCYRLLKIRINIESLHLQKLQKQKKDRVVVVILPHPSVLALVGVGYAVTQYIYPRACAVGKIEHLWNPFGWGLWALGSPLIQRANNVSAIEKIHKKIKQWHNHPVAMIICPDSTRPTPKKIHANQKRLRTRGQYHLAEAYRFTTSPRSRGLQAIIDACPKNKHVFVQMTATFDVEQWRICDVSKVIGRTLYIRFQLSDLFLPHTLSRTQLVLNRQWIQANEWMMDILKQGSSGEKSIPPHIVQREKS